MTIIPQPPTRSRLCLNYLNAISNVINSVIGVGIVTLPKAFSDGGVAFGVATSFLCWLFILYTSDLMIKSSLKLHKEKGVYVKTYAALCNETLGVWAFYLLAFKIFMIMFFAMSVYAVLLRQETASIVGDFIGKTFLHDRLLLLGIMAGVFVLCLPRDVSKLGYASFLSTLLVASFIAILLVQSPEYHRLMKSLDQSKMVKNERKLDLERAVFICGKARSGAELYGVPTSGFPMHKAENFAALYGHLLGSGACSNGGRDGVLGAIRAFATPVVVANSHGQMESLAPPRDWSEAVSQAHAAALYETYSLHGDSRHAVSIRGVLSVIGIYSAAFIIQQATFGIYESLAVKSAKKWRQVLLPGMLIVYVLCICCALGGYYGQRHQVGEIVFQKMKLRYFDDSGRIDYATNVARVFLVATIVLTFPMMHWFAKRNFNVVFFYILSRCRNREYDPLNPPWQLYYLITAIIFAGDLAIGLFVDKIFTLYALIGSVFASPIIYVA